MIKDEDGKSLKARRLMGGESRVGRVVSGATSKQNGDDRMGVTRDAPLKVVVTGSYIPKGWSGYWNVY